MLSGSWLHGEGLLFLYMREGSAVHGREDDQHGRVWHHGRVEDHHRAETRNQTADAADATGSGDVATDVTTTGAVREVCVWSRHTKWQ